MSVAAPYLFQRLSPIITSSSLPGEVSKKLFPKMNLSKDELIVEVVDTLLSHSEPIMQGDYSGMVGDEELVSLKINIYEHMHQGFETMSDIKDRLSIDLKVLKPVLDQIESEVLNLLSKTRTIVVKDGAFFEDSAELKRVLNMSKDIDTSKT